MITIQLNGIPVSIEGEQTVLELLATRGITPARVAVELDRKILDRALWDKIRLEAGAEVEVVHFVGGGTQ